MNAVRLLGTGLLAFAAGTVLLRIILTRYRHSLPADLPNARSSHNRATPRGGGIAIVLGVMMAVALLALSDRTAMGIMLGGAVAGSLIVAGVSFRDDFCGVSYRVRLLVHLFAAAIVVWAVGWPTALDLPVVGEIVLGYWGLPLTLLWIVGLTNAYNFMDGIDGIAGAQGVIAGSAWALLGTAMNEPIAALIGVAITGSCLAFLRYNWHPAQMFMGDVGSAFLGYWLAVLPLVIYGNQHASEWNPAKLPILAALFVWPFLLDTGYTFLRRLVRGENVFRAHRSHLYQRLVIAGYGHQRVSILYMSGALAMTVTGVAWLIGVWGGSWAVVSQTLGLSILLTYIVNNAERRRGGGRGCGH